MTRMLRGSNAARRLKVVTGQTARQYTRPTNGLAMNPAISMNSQILVNPVKCRAMKSPRKDICTRSSTHRRERDGSRQSLMQRHVSPLHKRPSYGSWFWRTRTRWLPAGTQRRPAQRGQPLEPAGQCRCRHKEDGAQRDQRGIEPPKASEDVCAPGDEPENYDSKISIDQEYQRGPGKRSDSRRGQPAPRVQGSCCEILRGKRREEDERPHGAKRHKHGAVSPKYRPDVRHTRLSPCSRCPADVEEIAGQEYHRSSPACTETAGSARILRGSAVQA